MSKEKNVKDMPFGKQNYQLLVAGVLLALIGFVLMSGGGSDDPNVFNPDIFSFRRMTLAPLIILGGYGLVMYAIVKKPKVEE